MIRASAFRHRAFKFTRAGAKPYSWSSIRAYLFDNFFYLPDTTRLLAHAVTRHLLTMHFSVDSVQLSSPLSSISEVLKFRVGALRY